MAFCSGLERGIAETYPTYDYLTDIYVRSKDSVHENNDYRKCKTTTIVATVICGFRKSIILDYIAFAFTILSMAIEGFLRRRYAKNADDWVAK